MSKKTSTRVLWIDNLRGIALFGVLLLHTAGLADYIFLSSYILSFVLAAFFFLSGLLVQIPDRLNGFSGYLAKRVRILVVPYFVFSLVSYTFWFFITRKFGGHAGLHIDPLQQFLGIFYGTWGKSLMAYNRALWFFPCLFVVQILSFFVLRLNGQRKIIGFTVCAGIAGYYLPEIEPYPIVPWGGEFALRYFPYFVAGYYSKHLFLQKRIVISRKKCLVLASIIGIVHLCTFVFFTDLAPFFVYYLKGFSGIFCWLFVVYTLPAVPFFSAIGRESITVFALHDLTYSIFTGIAVYVFGVSASFKNDSIFYSIIYAFLAGSVLLVVAKLLHRYAPWVIGYRQ